MKKILSILLFVVVLMLSACDLVPGGTDVPDPGDKGNIGENIIIPRDPSKILIDDNKPCDYGVLVDDKCMDINDILSDNITVRGTDTIVSYDTNSVELMDDYVADLTGSAGLAVMSRDVFEENIDLSGTDAVEFINLAAETTVDDSTDNVIVTLTEAGFFEEVSFTDINGTEVEIMANPLALEVYGAFTVVIFEVNSQNYGDGYTPDFNQRVYDSLYSGGIYLIHNDSGKLFPTKEVTLQENSYTQTEDFSRYVTLTVTLNEPVVETLSEPVVDEFGEFVLDEFGNMTFEDVLVPVLDDEGNPLIYTEGPIQTEFIEIQIMETFEVEILEELQTPILDDDGNPVLDADGNPTYTIEMVPVLDEEGKPTFEVQEIPLLDEFGNPVVELIEQAVLDVDGNPVYVEEFQVDLYISDLRDITYTTYYSTVTDGPLTGLAQRFVDKIMQEYYNWSYWRPSYYSLSQNSFAVIGESIYYMEQKATGDNDSVLEQIVTKLSFDDVNEELTLEAYLNASKANFEDCEIILDPSNSNIICNPWDGNIKIYAPAPGPGLKTIEDSDGLQSVTFPNGELYFFDQNYNHEYIEELGYSTTALYTISDIGELETHYIELGSSLSLCDPYENNTCLDYISVTLEDSSGVALDDTWGNYGTYIEINDGDARISDATLQLQSLGDFSSTRVDCGDETCYYQIQYEILDLAGNKLASFDTGGWYAGVENAPNFGETYQIDPTAHVQYEQVHTGNDRLCDELVAGIGCNDEFYLIDESISEHDAWVHLEQIVQDGAPLVDRLYINETNSVVYEYTKDVSGFLCEYTTCEEIVDILITDLDGTVLREESNWMTFAQDEMVPIRVEFTITDDTVVTYTDDVCTTSTGCWRGYQLEGSWLNIQYEQGDDMYATIEFAETDIVYVTQETLTNEVCVDLDGCGWTYATYIVSDGDTELYRNEQVYFNYDYGTQIPFRVLIDISDTTQETEKEYGNEDRVCDEDVCTNYVYFYFVDDTVATDHQDYWGNFIGSQPYSYVRDETMINRIGVPESTEPTVEDNLLCKELDGCQRYTQNYKIIDEFGTEYQVTRDDWYSYSLPVMFAYNDPIPNTEDFEVTYLIKDIVYYEERIQVYSFMWSLNSTTILDDNLYLIEKDSWAQGENNFILSFNEETNRYSVKYTNISAVIEITQFNDSYIAINDDETAIIEFTYNETMSDDNFYYFDVIDLTDGLAINGVSDLIVDFDGSIYFSGVDNYVQDITGRINELGEVIIDTDYTPVEIVRVRPIN